MEREGKKLKDLGDGAKRRLPDMKNAWRKASPAQRVEMMDWIQAGAIDEDTADGIAKEWVEPDR